VRAYLNECRYAFREFGAPGVGDVGTKGRIYASSAGSGAGGILGIAVASAELGGLRSAAEIERVAVAAAEEDEEGHADEGVGGRVVSQTGKITVVKAEDVVAKV